jgi:hypothetical protein
VRYLACRTTPRRLAESESRRLEALLTTEAKPMRADKAPSAVLTSLGPKGRSVLYSSFVVAGSLGPATGRLRCLISCSSYGWGRCPSLSGRGAKYSRKRCICPSR